MKILVVDDERAFGSLLARALKQLGHTAIVKVHPDDALAELDHTPVDAVITDIDMPRMNGVELAQRIRVDEPDMPIAFCTGSDPADEILEHARTLGRVLPKVWTVADVRGVVESLDRQRAQFARLADAAPIPLIKRKRRASTIGGTRRQNLQKIKLSCRSWGRVAKLCGDCEAGAGQLTIRGDYPLSVGEPLIIALHLPDEITVSIAAHVARVGYDEKSGHRKFLIDLSGLDSETRSNLLRLCESRA